MKGFVPTPQALVDRMVSKLFESKPPTPTDLVLDPGCGRGEFIAGVIRWCENNHQTVPTVVGVENDPHHWAPAHSRFLGNRQVKIRRRDFLKPDSTKYDYIIGNPPYVPITEISQEERAEYREAGYATASGRMDLYMLFFEAALGRLAKHGRLVFVTPEKFLYVETGLPLRRLMATLSVEEVELLPEDTFPGLTTYPAVTTIVNQRTSHSTIFVQRPGNRHNSMIPPDGSTWLPASMGYSKKSQGPILDDVSLRISAGVATGADGVFVIPSDKVGADLAPFAYPTISGRDLRPGSPLPSPSDSMLVPYQSDGRLRSPEEAGKLFEYLSQHERRVKLNSRTCVQRKPWYAFHDSVPLPDIRRPKVVWKDISEDPAFWVDRSGSLVPRHSVYYLVPKNPGMLDPIAEYLASKEAAGWIRAHCHRAANGFLRLQSNVLREMPVPNSLLTDESRGPTALELLDGVAQPGG